MVEDIMNYLESGDEDEYETNQQYIGVDQLFRGFVVKDWQEANFHSTKYRILNKILVYHSVHHYNECWKHRNEAYHDPIKQRNRMLEWYNKIKNYIERNEPRMVNLYIRKHEINVNECTTDTIRKWILNAKEVMKKAEKLKKNDIRRYFEC